MVTHSDHIEELLRLFHERAPIVRTFGMRLAFRGGQAVVTLPYNPALDQGIGMVHGGVYATLMDTAGWFTVAAAAGTQRVVTVEMSIHFLGPARGVDLRAEGRHIRRGARHHVVEMTAIDGSGALVGHATGTFLARPGAGLEDRGGTR